VPACAEVCPTQARHKRIHDGVVLTNYSKCIGCRYCMVACPYGVNYFNWASPKKSQYFDWENDGSDLYGLGSIKNYFEDIIPPNMNPDVSRRDINYLQSRFIGVVEKCTFCVHRIEKGLQNGKEPGVDREATPACVITCPVSTLHFGDLDDPKSKVSKLLRSQNWRKSKDEIGTHPKVYYIY